MKADEALRLFFPLIQLAVGILQVFTQVRAQFAWKRQAYAEVGDLGTWYRIVIVAPLWFLTVCLGIMLGANFGAVSVGALVATGFGVPARLSTFFSYSPLIAVCGLFVTALIYLNVLQEAALALSRLFDAVRFKVGWVNARWQLRHHRQFFAINVDESGCERLGHLVFEDIVNKRAQLLPYQAPKPRGLTQDELANYLLVGCALESRMGQLPPDARPRLDQAWQALAEAAVNPARPFAPENVKNIQPTARGFYETLRQLAPQPALPSVPLLQQTVDRVGQRLVERFSGYGRRLATRKLFRRAGFPPLLLRRLRTFDRYSESESIRRLFLKLAVRMKVWPDMAVGPFLYPFNFGIASLLLNSGCLVVPSDVDTIEASEEFANIAAEAEDRVAGSIYGMVIASGEVARTRTFAEHVFETEPRQLNRWVLSDYVDLWLFAHTRDFCRRRTGDVGGQELGCPLRVEQGRCYCDVARRRWRPSERRLVSETA